MSKLTTGKHRAVPLRKVSSRKQELSMQKRSSNARGMRTWNGSFEETALVVESKFMLDIMGLYDKVRYTIVSYDHIISMLRALTHNAVFSIASVIVNY